MSFARAGLKYSIFLLFAIGLLNSCNPAPEKITPEEYYTPEKIPPKAYTVEIKEMRFDPAELTVRRGDTVIFVNHDLVSHDVTEEVNKAWSSSPLPVGKSWSLVVTKSSDYYCSIHVVMKGKLVVQQP